MRVIHVDVFSFAVREVDADRKGWQLIPVNDVFIADIIELSGVCAEWRYRLQRSPLVLIATSLGEILDESDFVPVVSHPGEPAGHVKDSDVVCSPRIRHCLTSSTDRVLAVAHNSLVQARYRE